MGLRDGRRSPVLAGVSFVLLIITGILRLTLAQKQRQREEEIKRGEKILESILTMTPGPAETTMSPAPVAPPTAKASASAATSHEGWVVESMTAWCDGERWAGRAYVRATTEAPKTWGFAFTLLDGTRAVGTLTGHSDGMAFMESHPVRLTSLDPCAQGRFGYRWGVTDER
jgi:hypothetical protein